MKFYAIATTERASKGQGGNKFLKIEVTDELNNCFAYMYINDVDGQTHVQAEFADHITVNGKLWGDKMIIDKVNSPHHLAVIQANYDLGDKEITENTEDTIKGEQKKGDLCDMEDCGYEHPHSIELHNN